MVPSRSFGLDALDRRLGGGLPAGKLSVLVAPPDSQAELLADRLASRHPALYLSTHRPAGEVADHLAVTDEDHETTSVTSVPPDRLLDDAELHLSSVPPDGIVVVETANDLEAQGRAAYGGFLDTLRAAADEADAAALLLCHERQRQSETRTFTLGRADLVMRIRLRFHPRLVETYFTVSKHRGGRALVEPLKLRLTDHVRVDTSRDIG